MEGVLAVPAAVLLHLDALAVVLLVLHRDVVAALAGLACERDLDPLVALCHRCLLLSDSLAASCGSLMAGALTVLLVAYLLILVTRPAPTVRPPSRIANRNPSSMAIGLPSSTLISVLSAGITITVPSRNATVPATSVLRK